MSASAVRDALIAGIATAQRVRPELGLDLDTSQIRTLANHLASDVDEANREPAMYRGYLASELADTFRDLTREAA